MGITEQLKSNEITTITPPKELNLGKIVKFITYELFEHVQGEKVLKLKNEEKINLSNEAKIKLLNEALAELKILQDSQEGNDPVNEIIQTLRESISTYIESLS